MGSKFCIEDRKSISQARNTTLNEHMQSVSQRSIAQCFIPCRYLGKGIYGTTVEVFSKDRKEERYAQKILDTSWLAEDYAFLTPSIVREFSGSRLLRPKLWVSEGSKLYIIMEKMTMGDLHYYSKTNKNSITEENLKGICIQLLNALRELHSYNLIYRCLTP